MHNAVHVLTMLTRVKSFHKIVNRPVDQEWLRIFALVTKIKNKHLITPLPGQMVNYLYLIIIIVFIENCLDLE